MKTAKKYALAISIAMWLWLGLSIFVSHHMQPYVFQLIRH